MVLAIASGFGIFLLVINIHISIAQDEPVVAQQQQQEPLIVTLRNELKKLVANSKPYYENLLSISKEAARRSDWQNIYRNVMSVTYGKGLAVYKQDIAKYDSLNDLIQISIKQNDTALVKFIGNFIYIVDLGVTFPDLFKELHSSDSNLANDMEWAINYFMSNEIFEAVDLEKIIVLAKELKIIEKEEGFVNPFIHIVPSEDIIDVVSTKKVKEKRKRGPGLSSEL